MIQRRSWLRRRTGFGIKRGNKFGAVPVHDTRTGESWDSTGEHRRWRELQLWERAGIVRNLVLKPPAVVLDQAAGIAWRVDYRYERDGRTVWSDHKPRPLTAVERVYLKLWAAHGPGLLELTGWKGGRSVVLRHVMPRRAQPCRLLHDPARLAPLCKDCHAKVREGNAGPHAEATEGG